ncbi:MAG TPA: DUF2784 domain-containing protein [Thermoanaerobaculia bacterium]|nr:DUF2784 domain-containing protein [Thermoanaerobaculia bacterium]
MAYRLLADALVVLHTAFVCFVVLGGLLVLRWQRLAWLHLPAAVWGAGIELAGGVCPLTPLESHFRVLGGEAGYRGGFIEHYLLPLLYPAGLSRGVQLVLGGAVLLFNVAVYLRLILRRRPAAGAPS